MRDLMIDVATELRMSLISLKVTSTGLYSAGSTAYPTPAGVCVKRAKAGNEYVDDLVLRAQLVKLMTNPELMSSDIRFQATMILNHVTKLNHITANVKFKVDGERLMLISDLGRYRINVETLNVTKLINDKWIIINEDKVIYDRITKLHATLIQVGLM